MADDLGNVWAMVQGFLNMGIGFWIILFCIMAVGLIAFVLFNKRYPKVLFRVNKEGVEMDMMFRLDGDLVLDDNIIAILMNRQEMKENVKDFRRVFVAGKGFVYKAFMLHGTLIPEVSRLSDDKTVVYVNPEELRLGQKVFRRYAEGIKFSQEQIKAQEPLGLALIIALPIALVVGVFVLGLYLAQDSLVKNATTASQINLETMKLANATFSQMNQILMSKGYTPVTFYNASGEGGDR
jgi:hypothetical protein